MYDYTENYYTNQNNTSRPITDLDLVFGLHPISKDIRKKNNVEAIKQSIKVLVLLNHYEKPFHPDLGCDIQKSMFELFEGKFTEEMMKSHILYTLESYEPRAEINEVIVDVKEDNNFLGITVIFTPVNEVESFSVDIFLRILR